MSLYGISLIGTLSELTLNASTRLFSDEKDIDSISYETIMLLRCYLEEFLHELIRHSIVFAETERNMKAQTKVWRGMYDEVSPEYVTPTSEHSPDR
jgi:hypothetical protein